jgi:membrane protease YdiL (CAAX protease family)
LVALWSIGIGLGYLLSGDAEQEEDRGGAAQQSTLQSWERVYQVNAALESQSALLRWLLAYEPSADLRKQARDELFDLDQAKQLDERGRAILASLILTSGEDMTPKDQARWKKALDPALSRLLAESKVSAEDFSLWLEKLEVGEVMPWEWEWLVAALTTEQKAQWRELIAKRSAQDQQRMWSYTAASALFAACFLFGLSCLPAWYRAIVGPQSAPLSWPRFAYAGRISLALMVTWMIIAEWGNALLFELLHTIGEPVAESWWWLITADALWRILPVLVILAVLYRSRKVIVTRFGLNQRPAWRLIFATYAILMMLDLIWNGALDWWGVGIESVPLDPLEEGWSGLVYGLVSACLMAPLAEEFFYRGFLFRSLQPRLGFFIAALLSSIVFAVSHYYDLYGTVSVAFCGMATAWLFAATRSLTSSILLHAFYNLSITIPSWVLFYAP